MMLADSANQHVPALVRIVQRNPIMSRECPVQESVIREQDFMDGPIRAYDVFEERDRLFMDRRSQFIGELGKPFGVNAAKLVEAIESKPLAKELDRQPSRFSIAQHAPRLTSQHVRILQCAAFGHLPQFLIRNRRPQEEAEPVGQFPIGKWHDSRSFQRAFDAIQECRSHQDSREQRTHCLCVT